MPIHDWTKVDAGIFHDFHHSWIEEIKRALNRGLLPAGYYALAEQITGGIGPDVLTLEGPTSGGPKIAPIEGGVALADAPLKVQFHSKTEVDQYAGKAKAVAIRHTSDHKVVAIIEVVSPGNKSSRRAFGTFVDKAAQILRNGIHLLVCDLFPPGSRDPNGIYRAIWEEFVDSDYVLPAGKTRTFASFVGGSTREAYVETIDLGEAIPKMALFVTESVYVPVPLEETYNAAWDAVPEFWRDVLCASSSS